MRYPVSFLIALLCLLTSFATVPASGQSADETESCLPPTYFIGARVRVVGSVEAGGLPVRERIGLANPVIGFLPLETRFVAEDSQCFEGRRWLRVTDIPVGDTHLSGSVVADDGVTSWLESDWTDTNVTLQLAGEREWITDTYAVGSRLFIEVYDGRGLHPVNNRFYEVDPATGALTLSEYPYAATVTRELTDELDITDQVFGEASQRDFSLYVSPEGERILYFVPSRTVEDCAHFCYWMEGFVAQTDDLGDPISIGEVPTEAAIVDVNWGTDGRLYLLHVTESAPTFFTVGFCIVESCTIDGTIAQIAEAYGVVGINAGSLVTTSPNGRYLAITPIYQFDAETGQTVILDTETGGVIRLPDNGSAGVLVFWRSDAQVFYPVNSAAVFDRDAYGDRIEDNEDKLFYTLLDFENGTYRFAENMVEELAGQDLFYDSWRYNWINIGSALFLPQDYLRVVRGGLG